MRTACLCLPGARTRATTARHQVLGHVPPLPGIRHVQIQCHIRNGEMRIKTLHCQPKFLCVYKRFSDASNSKEQGFFRIQMVQRIPVCCTPCYHCVQAEGWGYSGNEGGAPERPPNCSLGADTEVCKWSVTRKSLHFPCRIPPAVLRRIRWCLKQHHTSPVFESEIWVKEKGWSYHWDTGKQVTQPQMKGWDLGLEQSLHYTEEGAGPRKALEQAVWAHSRAEITFFFLGPKFFPSGKKNWPWDFEKEVSWEPLSLVDKE